MRLSQRATARLRATARSTASAQRSDAISFGATAPTWKVPVISQGAVETEPYVVVSFQATA